MGYVGIDVVGHGLSIRVTWMLMRSSGVGIIQYNEASSSHLLFISGHLRVFFDVSLGDDLGRRLLQETLDVDSPRLEPSERSLSVVPALVLQDGVVQVDFSGSLLLVLLGLPFWEECQVVISRDGQDLVDRSCQDRITV